MIFWLILPHWKMFSSMSFGLNTSWLTRPSNGLPSNFFGNSLLTYQRFNHLKESTHDSFFNIILDNNFLNDYTGFGNTHHKMVSSSSDLPKAALNIVQGIILLQLRELAYMLDKFSKLKCGTWTCCSLTKASICFTTRRAGTCAR